MCWFTFQQGRNPNDLGDPLTFPPAHSGQTFNCQCIWEKKKFKFYSEEFILLTS